MKENNVLHLMIEEKLIQNISYVTVVQERAIVLYSAQSLFLCNEIRYV